MTSQPQPYHVAISGEIGSGKSSVARRLAERLEARLFSTGGIQREIAERRGMTTLELNLYAEQHPEIDREIDGFTIALNEVDYSFVIDSRLAWNFLDRALKVNLLVDHGVAVERIMGDGRRGRIESYRSRQEGVEDVAARRASERRRFLDKYDVDVEDPRNFDLILDTTEVAVDQAVDLVYEVVTGGSSAESGPSLWLCPRNLFPTRHADEVAETARALVAADASPSPIAVVIVDGRIHVLEGHARVSAAIRAGRPLIPARLAAVDDEEASLGITARAYARERSDKRCLDAWQDSHGLRFSAPPVAVRQ